MLKLISGGFLKKGDVGEFEYVNVTDEDVVLQVDGNSIIRTGLANNGNLFIGCGVFDKDDGLSNIGIGFEAGFNNTTAGGSEGQNSLYIGYQAGYGLGGSNAGQFSIGLGFQTLYQQSTGDRNTAIGYQALRNTGAGRRNTAIGYQALLDNTRGDYNFAIGPTALRYNTLGSENVAIGYAAGIFNETGDYNTVIGSFAGGFGAGGVNSFNRHTIIGNYAGYKNSTGGDGVYIGFKAGYNQTSNSNLLIIDNQDRGSAANEATMALIYGVFAAAAADQDLTFNANIFLTQIKSGSDQANAGAAANEIWKTSGHATLPDNVLMIGV